MDYPISVYGATGALIGEKAIICGGASPHTDECYAITATNAQLLTRMTNKRYYAASAKITSTSFIVTGGYDGANILSSSEIIDSDGSVTPGPELPLPLYQHSMININDTFMLIIGGAAGGHNSH